MRKPIFNNLWYHGKTPVLQIKILKSIVTSGQLSKKKVTDMLHANYPDVSNSMDALLERKFIKLSDKYQTSGRNPEKFYKITEKGLRAFLDVKLYQDEFWKAITLLCISSKNPVNEKEFEDYFHKFERNFLGHSNIHGYFFLSRLFDNILDQWLQAYSDSQLIPISQKVIECLAFNGPSIMQKLVEEISASEEELIEVIDNYSAQNTAGQSDMNIDKNKIYNDFILHILVVAKETTAGIAYELSLFGVMLAIAIISYHFTGTDTFRSPDKIYRSITRGGPKLFYNNINQKQYIDIIALNYRGKIPLLFGKWDLLKSQLGTMLYDGFDFLIYKASRLYTIDETVWSFGTKEFYDDIQILTYNAIRRLIPIYAYGIANLREYENCQTWIANNPRIIPVYNKLREIEGILKYADIIFALEELRYGNHLESGFHDRKLYATSNDIKNIESIFRDELSFLFYLSLNTIFLPASYKNPSAKEEKQEFFTLGGPRQRLMAVLAKDKDIKRFFSTWLAGIMEYRSQTSEKMSEFYDRVINAHENSKVNKFDSSHGRKNAIAFLPKEYDITKICSDFESVYNYTT